MSTLIANFCLDNDEAIIVRQAASPNYIALKLPSRSGYIHLPKEEFEALKEGMAMMFYAENKKANRPRATKG